MALVANNTVTSVHYTGRFEDGKVFDTNEGGEPLVFLVGNRQMISGFEEELMGAKPGETREFTLTPDRAYGERNEQAFQVMNRSVFGEGAQLEVGLSSYAQTVDGSMTMFTITEIDGDNVTLDFNHVMAGKTLTFTVTVADVREATEDEICGPSANGEKTSGCGDGCGCN